MLELCKVDAWHRLDHGLILYGLMNQINQRKEKINSKAGFSSSAVKDAEYQ